MTTKTDHANEQWRKGDNEFRIVTIKGADTDVFVDGQLMQLDPVDNTYIAYTGALAADRVRAILSLGVGENTVIAAAELTPKATICISGSVNSDQLVYPGAFGIDSYPNGAVLSIREQLREVDILAFDATQLNADSV